MDFLKKAGLVSISFRKNTVSEIASAVTAAGLSYVEWGSDVHAKKDSTTALFNIAEIQKETGIKCSSYGTYFKLGVNDTDELYAYADAANILGTNVIRIWAGNRDARDMDYAEKLRLFGDIKKAAKIAEERNVTFCFECHDRTYVSEINSALALLDYAQSDKIAMYWQPNQFRSLETNLEYAQSIAPYAKVIHVFNWEGNGRFPLAESVETWKKYLCLFGNSLEKNDVKFLLEFMPDDRIETLTTEAQALRDILRY